MKLIVNPYYIISYLLETNYYHCISFGTIEPAQDIHILVNHKNLQFSPWYELDVNAPETITAKYTFKPTVIKRFRRLQ